MNNVLQEAVLSTDWEQGASQEKVDQMKHTMLVLSLLAFAAFLAPGDANAVVCARGVVRAGCVGTSGAAVVRQPVVVAPVVVRQPVVVAPACAWVNGVRVCR